MEELGRDRIVSLLCPYFKKREDVLMAFLFGSWVRERQCMESDVDIAIYFSPRGGYLEYMDEDARYEGEEGIWSDVERILKREVDLLILNRAFPEVAESAMLGVPIVVKDRGVYLELLLRITREAEDMRGFVNEYWKLKERYRNGSPRGR